MIFFIIVIWAVLLYSVKRLNIQFFYFLLGSVGLFGIAMYFGNTWAEQYLGNIVANILHMLSNILNIYRVYPEYSMIIVSNQSNVVSFFIDYECSGFIEILVFLCLVLFYPINTYRERLFYSIIGIVYIILANVVRIIIICVIVKFLGISVFFITHTVIARLIFFAFMVILYYFVFTKPHIIKQKVGGLTYGD